MLAQTLLDSLTSVRESGKFQWMAKCPAHKDKTASLSIKEDADRVLLHCFAGCGANEVLNAVGMKFEDLYPDHPYRRKEYTRPRISYSDAYQILNMEGLVLLHIAKDVERGQKVDTDRIIDCLSRINKVNQMLGRK